MDNQQKNPFFIKNCALAAIATGEKANSLVEFRDKLLITQLACVYFHFWGNRMRSEFVHPEYHNDFAGWAHRSLHDPYLAERLSIIDPTDYNNLEALRQKILDIVEERLDENQSLYWVKDRPFHFIRSKIIVFETQQKINHPKELTKILSQLPPSSIFYHFIDARSRTKDGKDDFSNWLMSFGTQYDSLVEKIRAIDPYFLSLTDLRLSLTDVVQTYFKNEGQSND